MKTNPVSTTSTQYNETTPADFLQLHHPSQSQDPLISNPIIEDLALLADDEYFRSVFEQEEPKSESD